MDNYFKGDITHIVGIDEAGRGPLAGPVSIGMVQIPLSFDLSLLTGVRDSKQLPQHKREGWFEKIKEWDKEERLSYKVTHVGHGIIDNEGMTQALRRGISRILRDIDEKHSYILLDGLLYAPGRFTHQKTIIKGDEKIPIISLASICAKVTRDAKMRRFSYEHDEYGFEQHKGYGTVRHRKAIQAHGLCEIHRKRYCESL